MMDLGCNTDFLKKEENIPVFVQYSGSAYNTLNIVISKKSS